MLVSLILSDMYVPLPPIVTIYFSVLKAYLGSSCLSIMYIIIAPLEFIFFMTESLRTSVSKNLDVAINFLHIFSKNA